MNDPKKPIETTEELINAIDDGIEKALLDDLEEAQIYLLEHDIDPVSLGKRMAEQIKTLAEQSPLNWRNQTEQIQQERNALSSLTVTVSGSVDHLKAEINKLLRSSQASLALHHRNLNLDEMTEADLAQLLGELRFQLSEHRDSSDEDDDK